MTDREGTCTYVARKEDPPNWHGEEPEDWLLDRESPEGLDQEVWECPHDALDEREYCAFHTVPENLPDEVNEGQLFVEAINKASTSDDDEIARRKKQFVGATFGQFDIEGATLDAGDEHPIRLDHAVFTAGILADEAVIELGLFAQSALFETEDESISGVSFENAEFSWDGDLSFFDAEFSGDVSLLFGGAEFSGDGDLSFDNAEFRGGGRVSFRYAEFSGDGDLSFTHAEFSGDGDISFSGAEFSGNGDLSFRHAEFSGDGDISFTHAEFSGDGDISFSGAEFSGNGDLLFRHAEFSGDGDISFTHAEFSGNDDLSFNFAEFSGDGDLLFRRTKFSGDGDIVFVAVEFSGDGDLSFNSPLFSGDGDIVFGAAEFSGDGDISFNSAWLIGDGDLSFSGAEFSGDGDVTFFKTGFIGDGDISFGKAEINCRCSFYDSYFKADKKVSFTGAEVKKLLTFEVDADESSRYVRGQFDFSNALFHDELRFRSSEQSTTHQEEGDNGRPQFDVVFADAVDFSGATFEEPPDFSRTRFPADADFTDATLQNGDFQNADVTGTAEISTASFDGADLSGVNFSVANLTGASFERALLSRAELLGADLTRTKLYGALLGDARINRETTFWLRSDAPDRIPDDSRLPVRTLRMAKTKLRKHSHRQGAEPYCVYDPRYRGADRESNLEKAAETYGTLETLARQNSLPGLASECFLGRKDVQLKQYLRDRNWLMITRATVPTVVSRYGESPMRVLGTGAATILACGLAYYALDLIVNNKTGDHATLFESFYFSALTFTTLGYGDFAPATAAGRVLAVAETSMGVILLAILVFVFGRRATR